MNRIRKALPLALLLGALWLLLPSLALASCTGASPTWTSTPDQASVASCVSQAINGDTIHITPGSATWSSSGITIPSAKGLTIIGNGTPNSTAATMGASASCSNTTITVSGVTAFRATPNYGTSSLRVSCMALTYGSGSAIAFSILGSCTASGCPSLRLDNITYNGWAGHAFNGISYGISAIGDMFGVIDHSTVNGSSGYLQLVELSHASYLGVGFYGDNSWHLPENYGLANFLFIENNAFNTAGTTENEGNAGSLANQGGGRVVVRFNQFNNMDNYNFAIGWHGTESSGRPRSTRAFEFYSNTYTCSASCDSVASWRGGTGLVWGNTFNLTGASLNNAFSATTYRAQGNPNWGACDGSSVWDINDGVTYVTGTISSVSGGGPLYTLTINQTGGSPAQPWSNNYWSPVGAPYSIHDVSQLSGGEITSSGSNTVVLNAGPGGPGSWTPHTGDSIQILRATACIDQAGGRGAGSLYTGTDGNGNATPAQSSAQVLSPAYGWINNFNPAWGVAIESSPTWAGSGRVIRNRDFYVENSNQAQQSSPSSPFDGSTSGGAGTGIGHGTLANRPASCTNGTGYWATDSGPTWNNGTGQGQLFLCSGGSWGSAFYTPYTYPHPLISGAAPPPQTGAPAPPTNLTGTVH
jgi:hypothetical protein